MFLRSVHKVTRPMKPDLLEHGDAAMFQNCAKGFNETGLRMEMWKDRKI